MKTTSVTVLLLACFNMYGFCDEAPLVKIPQGSLKGVLQVSRKGRNFAAFLGIPYATPPINELRFKPPEPAEHWEGILNATVNDIICLQTIDGRVAGTEDCLYLNVYTPKISKSKRNALPVIVYIHGGFFQGGSGNPNWYGPKILLDHDIVLVTTNYRTGILGFLSTGDEVVPGNNALKDQNLALKWVKSNIQNFGGDPERIILSGQSAGATGAHLHMFSPLSKYLIKGMTVHSGSAMEHWALGTHKVIKNTKTLATLLNCPTEPSEELVNCLREKDGREMYQHESALFEWAIDPPRPFTPVVEVPHEGAFLSECPEEILKDGRAADVPLLIGLVTEDGGARVFSYFKEPKWIEEMNNDFDRVIPISFEYYYQTNKNDISAKLRSYYFGQKPIDGNAKAELTKMYTDVFYGFGIDKVVKSIAKYGKNKVYYYLFGYQGHASECNSKDGTNEYGVCHLDDFLYVFTMDHYFPGYKPTEEDEKMMNKLSGFWANFAYTGMPSSSWKPTGDDGSDYYFIRGPENMTMEKNLYGDRIQFLETLKMHSTDCRTL